MRKVIWFLLPLLLLGCGEETTAPSQKESPTNLRLQLISSSSIYATWVDRSENESGFILQRRLQSDTEFTILDSLPPNTESFLDTNLEPNRRYYYRIAAILPDEISNWSNVSSVVTTATISEMQFGEDESFEVMTWNIEKFPKNSSTTVSYVKQAILSLQVDVIALQEIKEQHTFYSMIDELQLEDNESDWSGDWLYCDNYGNNLAYIYRASQFTNVAIYSILNNDWYAFPRPPFVLEATFQNHDFIIINNHLKAMGDEESIERRREASLKLDAYIRENHFYDNVILLGDLNDTLTKPEADNVFWNFISAPDVYLFADWEIAYLPGSEWSYPSWPSHLDHILITYPLFDNLNLTKTIKIDGFLQGGWEEYEDNISDHRPVAMKLIMQ
jgi:endonuclease/exonuclease/phosphatase family metal-dependent hydrolase